MTFPVVSWLAAGQCDLPLDEAELRFTPGELRLLAQDQDLAAGSFEAIEQLAGGWPAAAVLAMAPAKRPLPAPSDASVYRTLAERVFDGYRPEIREALMKSAVFVEIEPSVLRETGWFADGAFDPIVHDALHIEQVGDGRFCFDGLFRDFLLDVLREHGSQVEWESVHRGGGRVRTYRTACGCARAGRAGQLPRSRILAGHGLALIDAEQPTSSKRRSRHWIAMTSPTDRRS